MDTRKVPSAGPGVVASPVASAGAPPAARHRTVRPVRSVQATRLRTQRPGLSYSRSHECTTMIGSTPVISRTLTF